LSVLAASTGVSRDEEEDSLEVDCMTITGLNLLHLMVEGVSLLIGHVPADTFSSALAQKRGDHPLKEVVTYGCRRYAYVRRAALLQRYRLLSFPQELGAVLEAGSSSQIAVRWPSAGTA